MNLCLRMPTVCLVLLLVITLTQAKGASLAPTECSQCHTGASHRMFAVKTDSSCVVCHSGMKLAHPLIRVSQSSDSLGAPSVPPAKAEISTKEKSSKVTAEPNPMALIPAGEFIMGFDDRMPDEGPRHKVYLDSYLIDLYEVTNAQY